MSTFVEELTIEREEDGVLVIKELNKNILTKGAWATVLYQYQEIDPKTGDYKPPAARIVRYRKRNGQYRAQSKFNISNKKQALAVAKILQEWFAEDESTE